MYICRGPIFHHVFDQVQSVPFFFFFFGGSHFENKLLPVTQFRQPYATIYFGRVCARCFSFTHFLLVCSLGRLDKIFTLGLMKKSTYFLSHETNDPKIKQK